MQASATQVRIRPLDELDITGVVRVDEKVTGEYDPERWESRIVYYLRRDPEASQVAEIDGKIVGFMLGEVRSGEFGLGEATGWIEVLGVDPACRGQAIGRQLFDAVIQHFRQRGAQKVRTLVEYESMPGIAAFFEALGFGTEPIRAYAMNLNSEGGARG